MERAPDAAWVDPDAPTVALDQGALARTYVAKRTERLAYIRAMANLRRAVAHAAALGYTPHFVGGRDLLAVWCAPAKVATARVPGRLVAVAGHAGQVGYLYLTRRALSPEAYTDPRILVEATEATLALASTLARERARTPLVRLGVASDRGRLVVVRSPTI